jgi:hypothetical protein
MAKQVKADKPNKSIDKKDYQRVVKESLRQKARAKETTSAAGGFIKGQMENYDLHSWAFKNALKLESMEVNQRNEAMRHLFRYIQLGDLLAQVDMFDDLFGILREMVAEQQDRPQERPVDPAITQLVN